MITPIQLTKIPMSQLTIGDSIFIPTVHPPSVMAKANRMARDCGIAITGVSGIDTLSELYGVRIQRIA